jgi:hypothetical protein
MLRVGKQPLVGRSTGSPTIKEAARKANLPPTFLSTGLDYPSIKLIQYYVGVVTHSN